MLCRNCGNSNADTARFCSSCGASQPIAQSPQPGSSDTTPEASDVTVLLPRRRADAIVAQAAQRAEPPRSPPPAPTPPTARSPTHRPSARAMKAGAAAAVLLIAIFAAAAFYANRPVMHSTNATPAPAGVSEPSPPGAPGASQSDARERPSTASEAPAQAVPALEPTPVADPAGTTQALPQADAAPTPIVAPPIKPVPRKRERAASPPPEPPPPEPPAPQTVQAAAPPPAPATPVAPVEAVKVEKVACADSSNLFSREACLWQECAKPEFHSHPECARFTGPR